MFVSLGPVDDNNNPRPGSEADRHTLVFRGWMSLFGTWRMPRVQHSVATTGKVLIDIDTIPSRCMRRASTKSHETKESGLHADGGDSPHERTEWSAMDTKLSRKTHTIVNKVYVVFKSHPDPIPSLYPFAGRSRSSLSPRLPITWNCW